MHVQFPVILGWWRGIYLRASCYVVPPEANAWFFSVVCLFPPSRLTPGLPRKVSDTDTLPLPHPLPRLRKSSSAERSFSEPSVEHPEVLKLIPRQRRTTLHASPFSPPVLLKHISSSAESVPISPDAPPSVTDMGLHSGMKRLSLPTPPPLGPASLVGLSPGQGCRATPLLVHSLSTPALPSPVSALPDGTHPSSSLLLLERALVRRHRHSVSGQMSYFKMLGFGLSPGGGLMLQHKRPGLGSTSSLFSTAVISGSSSAPNLRDMIPSTTSISGTFALCLCWSVKKEVTWRPFVQHYTCNAAFSTFHVPSFVAESSEARRKELTLP